MRARAKELTEFVSAASLRYQFDTAQLAVSGFWNRTNIAAAVLLLHPQMFPLRHPPEPDAPARARCRARPARRARVRRAGRFDTITPPDQAEKLVRRLRAAGADVVLHWASGGHAIDAEELAAAQVAERDRRRIDHRRMRTIRIEQTGGPEVMRIAEVPLPEPAADQVRIRVAAAGINFIDCYRRAGNYPVRVRSPRAARSRDSSKRWAQR